MSQNKRILKDFINFLWSEDTKIITGFLSIIGIILVSIFIEGFIAFPCKVYFLAFLVNGIQILLGWVLIELCTEIKNDWDYYKIVVLKNNCNYNDNNIEKKK